MRAIFIDAVNRKVEEVQVENELHAFYEKIGCDMIEIIHLGGEHLMVVDEEGSLRNWEVGFRLPKSEGIAGNALVVGITVMVISSTPTCRWSFLKLQCSF